MAVTTETQERERSDESAEARRAEKGSEESSGSEGPGGPGESSDSDPAPKPSHLLRKVGGGVAVFLLLGIYFVWIGSEMGGHASGGSSELWAIFGAIFLGVVAALAGGVMMRRKN